MTIATLFMPLQGMKKLWDVILGSPSSADGLEKFNITASFVSRGCLLIGGLTSTGYTYLLSYSIFKGLMPMAVASFLSFVAVVLLFIIFDAFLGVTFPLWADLWVQGRFKKDKTDPGNRLMRLAGMSLFLIAMLVAGVSIAFSYSAAEVPVIMSLTSIQSQDSTKSDLSKAFASQLTLQKIIDSYDRELKVAQSTDSYELAKLKKNGSNKIAAVHAKYSHPKYSRSKYASRMRDAKADSMNLVDSYQKKYDQVRRDKEHTISLQQSSSSRVEIAAMSEQNRLQAMFDRKMEQSITILRWLGIIGTVLFIFICFVQTVLNTCITASDKAAALKKRNNLLSSFNGGTVSNQAFNKSSRNNRERNWNKTHESQNSVEYTRDDSEQDGTDGSILVPHILEWKTPSQVRSAVSKHANNYANRTSQLGKDNEYVKFLAHVDALSTVDPDGAFLLAKSCQKKYGLPIDL